MLPASGAWPADLMAFMGQKGENVTVDSTEKLESSNPQASSLSKEKEGDQADKSADSVDEHSQSVTEEHVETVKPEEHEDHPAETNAEILEEANNATQKPEETNVIKDEQAGAVNKLTSSVKVLRISKRILTVLLDLMTRLLVVGLVQLPLVKVNMFSSIKFGIYLTFVVLVFKFTNTFAVFTVTIRAYLYA